MANARPHRFGALRGAFTLAELLVVIGVIAILIAIVAVVGLRAKTGAAEAITADTIRVLDVALSEYKNAKGGQPPPYVAVLSPNPNAPILQPVADAHGIGGDPAGPINSIAWLVRQLDSVPAAADALRGLNVKQITLAPRPDETAKIDHKTILDGWGRPMRYVHPAFSGQIEATPHALGAYGSPRMTADVLGPAPFGGSWRVTQLRRTVFSDADRNAMTTPLVGDGDGGVPVGGSPYFYSGGADGDPSTTSDNVYTFRPEFVK